MDESATNETLVEKERIRNFFEDFAETWDDRFAGSKASLFFKQKRLDMIAQRLGDGYSTLLEAGCGTGYHIMRLLKPGQKGLGIDVAESMLEKARQITARDAPDLDLEFQWDDGENLSLASDSFERIIFIGYLIHLQAPRKAVQELYRVLKPGGRVVGLVSNRWSPWLSLGIRKLTAKDYGVLPGDQEFSPPEVRRMFEEAGFKNVRLTVFNSLPGKLPDWAYYPGRVLNAAFSLWPISQLGFHILAVGEKD